MEVWMIHTGYEEISFPYYAELFINKLLLKIGFYFRNHRAPPSKLAELLINCELEIKE